MFACQIGPVLLLLKLRITVSMPALYNGCSLNNGLSSTMGPRTMHSTRIGLVNHASEGL